MPGPALGALGAWHPVARTGLVAQLPGGSHGAGSVPGEWSSFMPRPRPQPQVRPSITEHLNNFQMLLTS